MVYAGNIGLAQDWDLIINLAKEIKDLKITIWIVGEGIKKATFNQGSKKINLTI